MAFGQASGPPATARQMRELLELVVLAGHTDLRDARHPLGLTQRQAGGKFTRDEADALIEQLSQHVEDTEHTDHDSIGGAGTALHGNEAPMGTESSHTAASPGRVPPARRRTDPATRQAPMAPAPVETPRRAEAPRRAVSATPRQAAAERAAQALSSEVLAAELQRRGWIVMEP